MKKNIFLFLFLCTMLSAVASDFFKSVGNVFKSIGRHKMVTAVIGLNVIFPHCMISEQKERSDQFTVKKCTFGLLEKNNFFTRIPSILGFHAKVFVKDTKFAFIWWTIMLGAVGIAERKSLMGYVQSRMNS